VAEAPRIDILFGQPYPDARVSRTAHALAEAGYRVRVLAWDRSGRGARHTVDGKVRIEHARVRTRGGRGWRQLPFLAATLKRHWPALRDDAPDVLHAVDLPMLAAGIGLRRLVRRPGSVRRPLLVYDAFELYALMESHKYPAPMLGAIAAAERRLPRHADLVITPGEGRRRWFAERGIDSVVVGNWVDPPSPPPDRAAARAELDIDADRFCIAYAGGLEPSRDIERLLHAARRRPDDIVLIAGRGEQEPRVRAAAAELPNVRFLGWLTDPRPLLAATDCLYYALDPRHPYAAHPAPNTLYLAIAYASPLVHRGQGEIGVVAAQADIGEAFDHDASLDTAASLDAALDRLRRPERRAEIAKALRGLQDRYSARRAAEALVGAYAAMLGTSARPGAGILSP
jgi:glycosyltransferase involved in cell wall biosynthesis